MTDKYVKAIFNSINTTIELDYKLLHKYICEKALNKAKNKGYKFFSYKNESFYIKQDGKVLYMLDENDPIKDIEAFLLSDKA